MKNNSNTFFQRHGLNKFVTNIQEHLDNYETIKLPDNVLKEVRRTRKVFSLSKSLLLDYDDDFVNPDILNKITQCFKTIDGTLQNIAANSQLLQSLKQQNDSFISTISLIIVLSEKNNCLEYISDTENRISELFKRLHDNQDAIDKKSIENKNNIENIDKDISKLEKSIEDSSKKSSDALEKFKDKLESTNNDFELKYKHQLDEIKKEFDNAKIKINDEFHSIHQKFKESTQIRHKDILDEAESILAKLRGLHHAVAGEAIGGNFSEIAKQEYSSANWLRWLGGSILSLYCIAIIIIICFISNIPNFEPRWYHISLLVALSGTSISLSAYLLNQSERHRNSAFWARQMNLEVQAFEPFVLDIEDNDLKNQLRKSFAEKVFGHIYNPKNKLSADNKTKTGLPLENIPTNANNT